MAGFVCLDPLLNKNGLEGAGSNLASHHHSLHDAYESNRRATAIQVVISDRRLTWLTARGYLPGAARSNGGQTVTGSATGLRPARRCP